MEVENYLEAMRLIKLIDLTPEDYLDLSASHVLLYDEFIEWLKDFILSHETTSYQLQMIEDLMEIRAYDAISELFLPKDNEQLSIYDILWKNSGRWVLAKTPFALPNLGTLWAFMMLWKQF